MTLWNFNCSQCTSHNGKAGRSLAFYISIKSLHALVTNMCFLYCSVMKIDPLSSVKVLVPWKIRQCSRNMRECFLGCSSTICTRLMCVSKLEQQCRKMNFFFQISLPIQPKKKAKFCQVLCQRFAKCRIEYRRPPQAVQRAPPCRSTAASPASRASVRRILEASFSAVSKQNFASK